MRTEQHQQLQSLPLESLLKLLTIEAKKSHDGHYTIFAFTTGYKVALGTPDMTPWGASKVYAQLAEMPAFPTLKDAVIAALVSEKTFADYFDSCPQAWWEARISPAWDLRGHKK